MQVIKPISITGGQPSILLPLVVVIGMSAVKDYIEDRKRRLADKEENESLVQCVNPETRELEVRKWQDLRVGDVVRVSKDHFFPADLFLISAFERNQDSGLLTKKADCYVQTKNLDGETNLKTKNSVFEISKLCFPETNNLDESHLAGIYDFKAEIQCEPPGTNIYKYDGVVKVPKPRSTVTFFQGELIDDSTVYPINSDNLLLRGTILKNTECIYGAVVYTGHNTRIMMNSGATKMKTSKNEKMLN